MIMPTSRARAACFLNDFQVLRGPSATSMQLFGPAVSAMHEARLMIRDDQSKTVTGSTVLYVIHQRSENQIVAIFHSPKPLRKVLRAPTYINALRTAA